MVLLPASPGIPRSDKKHVQHEPQRKLHIRNSNHRRWRNTKGQANKPIPFNVLTYANTVAGYDEGGFSASVDLQSFKQDFNLVVDHWKDNPSGLASRKANITSFGVLGAAFGSLLALIFADRIGRLRSWQLFVLLWATGVFMQIFSSGIIGLMLFARIWGGLGAGGLTVIAPLYLSEIALARSRGTVISMFMVVLLSFLTIGPSFPSLSFSIFLNKKLQASLSITASNLGWLSVPPSTGSFKGSLSSPLVSRSSAPSSCQIRLDGSHLEIETKRH